MGTGENVSQEQDSSMTTEFEILPEDTSATPPQAEAQTDQPAKSAYSGPTPGSLLRAEREKRELSLQDIVTQSRMSLETIKALEEDRDPPQNAWVYVRGYYRKYARLLGIPEEEILHAHEQYAGGAPTPQPVSAEWAPQDVSPGGGMPRIVLVLIGGILLGGILWWLLPQLMSNEGQDQNQSLQQSVDSTVSKSISPSVPSVPVKKPVTRSTTTMPDEPVDQTVPDTTEDLSGNQDTATSLDMDEQAAASEVGETASGNAYAPASAHEDAAMATMGSKLAMEFLDRSWVNVLDANGKKLLDGIVKAGAEHALEGQPPFRVFLGYAPGVKLSYKGRVIDTKPYTSSNNTARFTVGAEPGDTP